MRFEKQAAWVLCGLALVSLVGYAARGAVHDTVVGTSVEALRTMPTIVVDAGHGGEDGGAVSPNGRPESAYNLDIALRTELFLRFLGMPTVMTRSEDISLHDESAGTLREKKRSDLHNRAALVNKIPGAVLLSIHQNTFPVARYSGAQVFYNRAPESAVLAKTVQDTLREALLPDNRREPKPLDVILMNETRGTGILVECGFLSNAEEEARLRQPGYQVKLSMIMSLSVTKWVNAAENETNDAVFLR